MTMKTPDVVTADLTTPANLTPLTLTADETKALDAAIASLPRSFLDKLVKDAIVYAMSGFEAKCPKLIDAALTNAVVARIQDTLDTEFKDQINAVVQAKAQQMVSRLRG